jgi:hypothetical protein
VDDGDRVETLDDLEVFRNVSWSNVSWSEEGKQQQTRKKDLLGTVPLGCWTVAAILITSVGGEERDKGDCSECVSGEVTVSSVKSEQARERDEDEEVKDEEKERQV